MSNTSEPSEPEAPARREYHAYGGCSEIFRCKAPEVLVEGPAGTGKSRAIGEYIRWYCMTYPGVRVLAFRKTRVSMNQSWLRTWEDEVLGKDHPLVLSGASKEHRTSYEFPNGSELVLGGMDNPTRLFSTQYDLAFCNEAQELSEDEWQSVHRALRNNKAPYQQLLGDCNPDAEFHWLNQRANTDVMVRIKTVHADNPSVTQEYLERLSNLRGVMRDRLYLGRWVTAEGAVWDNFDHNLHVIPERMDGEELLPEFTWTFASMDFGWRDPGVLQVWGVDDERRIYRVVEIYRCEMQLDWWAAQVVNLRKRYDLQAVVCDPSRPDCIELINERLGWKRGRDSGWIARSADNRRRSAKGKLGGLDMVRWALDRDDSGLPRMFFVADAHEHHPCPISKEKNKPDCTEQEIPSYVWAAPPERRPNAKPPEEPDPTCADHGCDATRYAAMFVWRHDFTGMDSEPVFPDGSAGDLLGHAQVLMGSK